jgi:hypothetical protein
MASGAQDLRTPVPAMEDHTGVGEKENVEVWEREGGDSIHYLKMPVEQAEY